MAAEQNNASRKAIQNMPPEVEFQDIRLDKGKPFGVVVPPDNDAHFAQDGFHFNAHGMLARSYLTEKTVELLRKKKASREAQAAARKAHDDALKNAGLDPEEYQVEIKDRVVIHDATDPDSIDLLAWAMGQRKYLFSFVRAAAEKKLDYVPDTAKQLIEFMVDNGLINKADVLVKY